MKKVMGNKKAYGSILHLPGSRLGEGDHQINEGQAKILTLSGKRCHHWWDNNYGCVVVTEKMDGSCCAVTRKDGNIVPLGRSGYRAESSKYKQHQMFADWVMSQQHRFRFLEEGQRVVGEWIAQAHGIRYRIGHDLPFFVFDIFTADENRIFTIELVKICGLFNFPMVPILHIGCPITVNSVKTFLERSKSSRTGNYPEWFSYEEGEYPEGAVWRLESNKGVEFLAKWVRPDKEDGKYLPEVSGGDSVWNWEP